MKQGVEEYISDVKLELTGKVAELGDEWKERKEDRGRHRWEENSPACPKFKQLLPRNILNKARERGQAGRKGEKKERKKKHLGDLKTAIVNR